MGASFALLSGALIIFLLSTSQYRLRLRTAIWFLGATLLLAAGWTAEDWRTDSLFLKMAADVWHGDTSWLSRLSKDWITVGEATLPLFGLSWLFAAALALLALTAFTPGDQIERAIRPLKFALIGAVGGAFIALFAVAIGLAGYYKHRVYTAGWSDVEILDGDTLIIGDVPIRLYGVDALELDQTCSIQPHKGASVGCGQQAKSHLQNLIRNTVVVCENRFPEAGDKPPRESFGRPLLQCFTKVRGRPDTDLGEAMIAAGYAFDYKAPKLPHYALVRQRAIREGRGPFKVSCVAAPDAYRKGDTAGSVGVCPTLPSPPRAPSRPGRS